MRSRGVRALAIALLLVPTHVAAGSRDGTGEGIRFPDDKDGGTTNVAAGTAGVQKVRFQVGGHCPDVRAFNVPLVGPEGGAEVAMESINQLCDDAVTNGGYQCDGTVDGMPTCFGLACCAATDPAFTQRISCRKDCTPNVHANPTEEFILQRVGTSGWLEVMPRGGTQVKHLTCQTDAGNTAEHDLLPLFNIGISRKGTDGVFTVSFATDPNDPNTAVSVSVDSADPNVVDPNASVADQDLQLHEALASGIAGLGLGLDPRCTAFYSAEQVSMNPDLYTGPFIHIPNMGETAVASVGLSGPEGASVTGESTVLGIAAIPTLSEWGLILLVAALFLTGHWLLRRRRPGEAV